MPHQGLSPQDQDPLRESPRSSAESQRHVAEEVRVLEGVLRRGRDGASAAWLRAAQHEVDQAWLRWRRASGDASRLD